MSSINIQLENELLNISGDKVTSESIAKALGYTPANKDVESVVDNHTKNSTTHITDAERTAWNNKSDFSGDYNDLSNKPNIAEEDDSKDLIIADDSGNIIARVDVDGIHTTDVEVNGKSVSEHLDDSIVHVTAADKAKWDNKSGFSGDYNDLTNKPNIAEDDSKELNITDESGNIIVKVDSQGIHTTEMDLDGMKVKETINSHTQDSNIHVTTTDKAKWNNKSDFSGDYNDLSNKPNIAEDNSGEVVIADNSGNVIAKVDAQGIHTTDVQVSGQSTLGHLNNEDIHVTAADKEKWDKGGFSGSYNDLTDVPTNLASFDYVDQKDIQCLLNANSYTNAMIDNEVIDRNEAITDAKNEVKAELSDYVVSDSKEYLIADSNGNIIMRVDADGIATTQMTVKALVLDDKQVSECTSEQIAELFKPYL